MIGLILIDIDGTLVGAGNRVPASAWTEIAKAQSLGRKVALCTGRPCAGNSVGYARRVDSFGAHIFQSGAVLCAPGGEAVHSVRLPPASYAGLVQLARENGEPLEAYTAKDCFVERPNHHTISHAKELDLIIEERDLLHIDLDREPVVRVQWIVPWAKWPTIEALTARDAELQISVATHPGLIETCFSSVTARGVSKASAAVWLAGYHGLAIDEVAMIGDGDNDLDVVRVVGLGIAMGNATATLKAAADVVVGAVEADGLAEAIDEALAH